ncbi:MAG: tyrosine-type recombinase/integrase [Alkaliphilus sp.]
MPGQLINRGKSIWLVRMFLGRDENGKRVYHNKTIHGNKKAAQAYLNRILLEKDTGTFYEPSKEVLSVYLEKWLEVAVKNRVTEKTHDSYTYLIKLYINPELGDIPISQLTAIRVQDMYNSLIKKNLSSRTVRYVHSVLRNALEQAVKWQSIKQNPTQYVDLPKHEKTQEITALSVEETKRFLDASTFNRWGVLFELMITTGLRPGEAYGLTWNNVDFIKKQIYVIKAISRVKGKWTLKEPKTKKSKRTLPLPETTLQRLKDHKKEQTLEKLKARDYNDHAFVFASNNGNPLEARNVINQYFKPLLEQVGLPRTIRLYDLRHTCATLLMASDVNPKVVAERLGHSNVSMTLNTYTHVLPGMQEEATNKLDKLLFL